MRSMVKCGFPLSEAVRMTTAAPLHMMGLDAKKGVLRPGYDADLCIFGGEINLKQVFCAGVPVLNSQTFTV